MAKRFQLRRGNTSETNAFTGALGEVTVDTDKDVVVVHDGATVGGHPTAARANTDGSVSFIARNGGVLGTVLSNGTLQSADLNLTGASARVGNIPTTPTFGLARVAIGDSDTGVAQNGDGVLQLWSNNVPTFQTSNGSDLFQARSADALRPAFFVRAWVNFNGTNGAIRSSGNVSSVVRNAVGDYTINFTTAMPDANYAIAGFANWTDNVQAAGLVSAHLNYTPTTTQFRIRVANSTTGNPIDLTHVNITITR